MENAEGISEAPLMNHLVELRQALIKSLAGLLIGFLASLYFASEIYEFLALPLKSILPPQSHFIATHPFEAWITYLKTALIAGLFLSSPVVFWQIGRFIAPGLQKKEKVLSVLIVAFVSLLFLAGAGFGYFGVFPFAFEFFTGLLEGSGIVFLPQMKDYLSFCFRMLLAFGIIFELPVIIVLLTTLGIVSIKSLLSFQKYMIVAAFFLSALLTPPDIVTQILMALPILALYQLGIVVSWLINRNRD